MSRGHAHCMSCDLPCMLQVCIACDNEFGVQSVPGELPLASLHQRESELSHASEMSAVSGHTSLCPSCSVAPPT